MFSSHDILYSDTVNFNLHNFKPLRTIWIACSHVVIAISMGTLIVIDLAHTGINYETCHFLLGQAAFWLISFVFYLGCTSKHHNLKLGGHFVFYKKMKIIGLLLFIVPSFFSSFILFVMAMLKEIYNGNGDVNENKIESINKYFITIGILIEVFIEIIILITYLVSIKNFNRLKPVPDVEQYEYLLPCDARLSPEIGYRLEGEAVADLLEKQADLLCYFKTTIIDLKSKLSELTASRY